MIVPIQRENIRGVHEMLKITLHKATSSRDPQFEKHYSKIIVKCHFNKPGNIPIHHEWKPGDPNTKSIVCAVASENGECLPTQQA